MLTFSVYIRAFPLSTRVLENRENCRLPAVYPLAVRGVR